MASDATDAKQLSERLLEITRTGFVSLGIILGSKLGIFDAMAAMNGPKSSHEIAKACCCKERYVREWLGFMATSDWITIDEDTQTYYLSDAQKEAMTSPDASSMAILHGAAMLLDNVLECFKEDGPNGFEPGDSMMKYFNKQRLSDDTPQNISSLLAIIPEMKTRLLPEGKVCEIGCGIGSMTHSLAQIYPATVFLGLDLCSSAIETAQKLSCDKGLQNVSFMAQDAGSMSSDWEDSFNVVFARELIHDLPYPEKVLEGARKILGPGGVFVMIDVFSHPTVSENKKLPYMFETYGWSLFNCLPSSMNGEKPAGLGPLWGEKAATKLLSSVGFRVEKCLSHEGLMIMICSKN